MTPKSPLIRHAIKLVVVCLLAAICFVVMSLCGVGVCLLADFVFDHASKDTGGVIYWGLRAVCLVYCVFCTGLLVMHLYCHSWDFALELSSMVKKSQTLRTPFGWRSFLYFLLYVVIGALLFLPAACTSVLIAEGRHWLEAHHTSSFGSSVKWTTVIGEALIFVFAALDFLVFMVASTFLSKHPTFWKE